MRYCPMCGDSRNQQFIGKIGPDAVIRCGICGIQYYRDLDDDPIISMSEWGSYRYDGELDMKVLRKRAEGAVRYFNNGRPRVEMQTHVFGYPFSIIHNGKLVDEDNAYRGNHIIRALSYGGGIYEGKTILSYNDGYNDGRGEGGSGCVLIGDVREVKIVGDQLIISGVDLNKRKTYSYLIQDYPDTKAFVKPIPKGGKVPPEPERKQPTIDDFAPKEEPKPKPVPKERPKPIPAPKKEVPKPAPKPVVKPKTAPKPEPKPAKPKKTKSSGYETFEVRVDGKTVASFSEQSKALAIAKKLKKEGKNARVYGVYL